MIQHVANKPITQDNFHAWTRPTQKRTKNAAAQANEMIRSVDEDARSIKKQPCIITGDLNGDTTTFDHMSSLIQNSKLHDVGAVPAKVNKGKRAAAPTFSPPLQP